MQVSDITAELQSLGAAGPIALLTREECVSVLRHEAVSQRTFEHGWRKGRAGTDPFYAHLAQDERFLRVLRPVLGNDILLWGVDILRREPNQVHPWHCDIESCDAEGGFVSVWIGLANTSRESSLNYVSRSHRFGITLQEEAHKRGLKRGDASDVDIIAWAETFDTEAQLVTPDMRDGDALFFDGRLWHGTRNLRTDGARTALLLQYARADRAVRMIDFNRLEWPFHVISDPWPPVIVVAGNGDPSINNIIQSQLAP